MKHLITRKVRVQLIFLLSSYNWKVIPTAFERMQAMSQMRTIHKLSCSFMQNPKRNEAVI